MVRQQLRPQHRGFWKNDQLVRPAPPPPAASIASTPPPPGADLGMRVGEERLLDHVLIYGLALFVVCVCVCVYVWCSCVCVLVQYNFCI